MNRTSRTLLIVDDSTEDREFYRRALLRDQEYAYTSLEATQGQQGLALWQQHQPDLVLLDFRLPDMDGLEFLSRLQRLAQSPALPVIVVTGQGNEAIAVQAMKAGAQDYLVKGQITPEGLHLAVHTAIEAVQLRTQLRQRIEREHVVTQMTRQIQQSLHLDDILQTTVTEVRQFLHTDRVLVFQLQPNGSGTVVAESVGSEWRSLLAATMHDPCLAEDCLRFHQAASLAHDAAGIGNHAKRDRQGQVTAIADTQNGSLDPALVEWLAPFQVKANLVVPILHDDQFWGLLIAHHCTAPRSWQPLEIDLLQELTTQVSIALRQAALYQQTQAELAERKRVEVELRESEARLRLALQASRMGTWDWNIQTGRIIWSDNLEALFGLASGVFDGSFEMFRERLHPDDRDRVQAAVHHAITTGDDYNIEFRVVYPNGYIRWALSQGKVFYTPDGLPIRMAGIDLDITDRKQAEDILRQSEQRYRTLFESMNEGFCIIELLFDEHNTPLDYRFLEINPAFEQQTGLKHAEGKTARQLLPDLESHWFERYGNVALTGEPVRFESGSDVMNRWFEVSAFRIGQPDHRRVAILFKDISDRKQVEQALRQSEERYRYLAEAIPQLVWTCDASGLCDYVNQQLCHYIGLTFEQAIGFGWLSAVHPDDLPATQAMWLDAVQHGTSYRHEYRFQRASDQSYRWHLGLGLPLKDPQGQVVKWFSTCTDIHDQKELEVERHQLLQQEQAARETAERANRIKDEFLAILSHELRSPINPILGWTKLLQTRSFDAAQTAQALATIERNARLQTQLIDDLLDMAKVLRGKLSLTVTPVNLVFVIESAIDTVKTAALSKSILLHPVLPNIGQVSGDATRLQQIVWNLLSNAIKFTPSGGRVTIQLARVNEQAQLIVSDTGKGVNPAFLPHIFESFRQEDISITRQYGGLGLGLAIVRQLVAAHGGTITADSPGEGQGATFTVRLPLLNMAPEPTQLDALTESEPDLTGIRVLTVDDDMDARELLTIILTAYGAEVVAVSSAADVFIALESFQPDLLISDIGMPEVDGYTLLQQLRSRSFENGGQTPAIALTAYAGEVDQQRALKMGFTQHLTKPIDPGELAQAVAAQVRTT